MHTLVVTSGSVPAQDDEAWDWLEAKDEDESTLHVGLDAQLSTLVARLTAAYPEIDNEECVWAEWPLSSCGHGDMLDVSVSGRHDGEGVQAFVVANATSLGLTVFDTFSSQIHRP